MQIDPKNTSSIIEEEQEEMDDTSTEDITNDAIEDDGTPVLDEKDLEENDLTVEEAEDIEWEEPKESK